MSKSWLDYKLVDMADALFDMGIDRSLVPLHGYLQVRSACKAQQFLVKQLIPFNLSVIFGRFSVSVPYSLVIII